MRVDDHPDRGQPLTEPAVRPRMTRWLISAYTMNVAKMTMLIAASSGP